VALSSGTDRVTNQLRGELRMYIEDIKEDSSWLMKGDCLERMKEIPDGSVDLILTDPPYGTTACKWNISLRHTPMRMKLC